MKKITIFIGLITFLLYGCSDFLDVNENPNYPTAVEDYLVLPAAQVSVANVFSADYGLVGSFWSQHWAQNNTSSQYKIYETYTFSNNTNVIDRSYRELYYGGLADNEIIHKQALTEENWGLYLMTATVKAFAFQYLVDLYDNVPYDEAFMGDEGNFSPIVNTGADVYASIYELLNTALAKDMSGFSAARYQSYDLLLGADISDWVDFANTLKLRILLRQVSANETWAITEMTNLLAIGSFLSTDVSLTNFEDLDSKSNPLYESDQRQLNTQNNIRANSTFTVYLKSVNDSRMSVLFDSIGGELDGMITGSYELPSTEFEAPKVIAKPHWDPMMPVHLMTVAETELLLAEAYLRTGDAGNAAVHYNNGVAASFARIGADGSGMLGAGEALEFPTGGTFEDQLEAIIMQKWVDAADGQRGIESFIEMNRTGYPALSDVSASIPEGKDIDLQTAAGYVPGTLVYSKRGTTGGKLPVRFPYANSETGFNKNAYEYANAPDATVMQTKVWWNK